MNDTTANHVHVASSEADARAVEAVKTHHAELSGQLGMHVEGLLRAATAPDAGGFSAARQRAAAFCAEELAPHARAEEQALYPAAASSERARLLVEGMLGEHQVILRLVDELRDSVDPVRAAAAGYALKVLFDAHLAKENDLVLPVVAGDPAVSLAAVLEGMRELLGGHEDAPATGGCGGGCGCGETDDDEPELDVRAVPHAIRHATVFGAFDAVAPGASMVLVAPHDPLPLLAQLRERNGGSLGVDYLERGPDAWRLRLTRS